MSNLIMQLFLYEHLPPHIRKVSEPFCRLAQEIVVSLPNNAARSTALIKLLEAKDCAVRAALATAS